MLEKIVREVCDECGANGPEMASSESDRQAAAEEDWDSHGEVDFCPACRKKAIAVQS